MSCNQECVANPASPPNDSVVLLERIHESICFQNVVLRTISNNLNEFQLKFVRHISSNTEKDSTLNDTLNQLRSSMQSFIDIASQYQAANCLKSKHYFAVPIGHNPGVYYNYDEAISQIEGYTDGYIKAFEFLSQAQDYITRFNNKDKESNPITIL
jgi:hypothetical protein